MKVLVTGASGFVGSAMVRRLLADASTQRVTATVRQGNGVPRAGDDPRRVECLISGLDAGQDWAPALVDVQAVVHCAARVHVMHDGAADPLHEFRRVNVEGTISLARQAAEAGVRRFVFISSVKVNGEATERARPFTADDMPVPLDAYGQSKHEAEQSLRELASHTGMSVVIVRPPLVYGPGVKANFASMMRWLRKGVPLPLGAIDNRRSLVALDNLVDLMHLCLTHPMAANQTFLVSDGEDVSTTQLLQRMGAALGSPARLLPVPPAWLEGCAAMLGKRAVAQRLCGSLQVDITKTRELLGWRPPLSLDEGLKKAAEGMDR
jgi:nucleoside-diphosphate-sugar epimerase